MGSIIIKFLGRTSSIPSSQSPSKPDCSTVSGSAYVCLLGNFYSPVRLVCKWSARNTSSEFCQTLAGGWTSMDFPPVFVWKVWLSSIHHFVDHSFLVKITTGRPLFCTQPNGGHHWWNLRGSGQVSPGNHLDHWRSLPRAMKKYPWSLLGSWVCLKIVYP